MKALSSRPRVCGKIRLTSKHTRIGLHLSVSVCAPMCAFMRVCMQSCYVYVCVCDRERESQDFSVQGLPGCHGD